MSLLLTVVVAIVLLAGSYLAGWSMGTKAGPGGTGSAEGCGQNEIVDRLIESGYLPPELNVNEPVTAFNGTVASVGKDYVNVSGQLSPIDPTTEIRALVTSSTEIVLQKPKPGGQLQREMDAFDAAELQWDPTSGEPPPVPPEPVTSTPGTLSDLNKGAVVTVVSEADMRQGEVAALRIVVSIPAEQEADDLEPEPEPEEELAEDPGVGDEPPVEEEAPVTDEP